MTAFLMILGLAMIYSIVHFMIIQMKAWSARTQYEKVVSVVGMVSIGLILLSMMMGN